jgi:hypothetical protein
MGGMDAGTIPAAHQTPPEAPTVTAPSVPAMPGSDPYRANATPSPDVHSEPGSRPMPEPSTMAPPPPLPPTTPAAEMPGVSGSTAGPALDAPIPPK